MLNPHQIINYEKIASYEKEPLIDVHNIHASYEKEPLIDLHALIDIAESQYKLCSK